MNIKELAGSYLETKLRKEEKRRQIDYDYPQMLKPLESIEDPIERNLRKLEHQGKVNAEEELYDQYTEEFNGIAAELILQLQEVSATRLNPLRTHVKDQTYFDTFLEGGEIISTGYYTKLS